MPDGKPAGVRCIHLTEEYLCALYEKPERPQVCINLRAMQEMCGETREHALRYLAWLEEETSPYGRVVVDKN
jgi:uncharacterized protein (DUF3820 family)